MNPTRLNRLPRRNRSSIRPGPLPLRLVLSFLVLLVAGAGRAAGPTESEVKAAFLYKFTAYTDWPNPTLAQAGAPIVIGVFADEPFATTLVSVVGTNRVRGHPLVVRKLDGVEEAEGCHLVFVAATASVQLPDIIAALGSKPVLLVGEGDKFCRGGGMIALRPAAGKMRFEVDAGRVLAAGLKISSQVIQLSMPPDKGPGTSRVR